ncbi:MAG: relaxase/mobilization nuclease domain-containing protein, partial [Richelia sp. RM1_1_1]|nr:relaxase/mobilization nuclease domain-containing protein [Richelia sp. RM1_1_1]
MIGNITKGSSFYGCVDYVLKDAQLVDTNMLGDNESDLAREFKYFSSLNQRVKSPVLHISLNPAPSDRILDEWEMCMIAQDLMEGLELKNNQFILV